MVRRRGPAERTAGSPQFGAHDEWRCDGAGRLVYEARHTPSGRVELATYGYDRLDRRVLVRRYGNPAQGTNPVDWTMAYDSLGQLLRVSEPGTSTRYHEYDEWGGLIESRWVDGGALRLSLSQFDGFGRAIDATLANVSIGGGGLLCMVSAPTRALPRSRGRAGEGPQRCPQPYLPSALPQPYLTSLRALVRGAAGLSRMLACPSMRGKGGSRGQAG